MSLFRDQYTENLFKFLMFLKEYLFIFIYFLRKLKKNKKRKNFALKNVKLCMYLFLK